MSSWEAAREKWELEHMQRIEAAKEAAANGDPDAMEIMASSMWHVQYNCKDQVMELLTAASDKGNGRASWKLADLYANQDAEKYHAKIELYCRRALAGGRTYSDENEDDSLCHSIYGWVNRHHPEWCEMEEGFESDGSYYLRLAYPRRYGMNVFRGIGEEAARQKFNEKKDS